MYRIATVCTGNICRSPMAQRILLDALGRAELGGDVSVDSFGISDEEHGNPIDPRAAAVLRAHGIDAEGHSARQITAADLSRYDLILAMDAPHLRALQEMAQRQQEAGRVALFGSFDPQRREAGQQEQGIADPWYGDAEGFNDTWDRITAAVDGVLDHVRTESPGRATEDR